MVLDDWRVCFGIPVFMHRMAADVIMLLRKLGHPDSCIVTVLMALAGVVMPEFLCGAGLAVFDDRKDT